VLEIRRRGKVGEESLLPAGDMIFQNDDQLILVGPTATVEALSEGKLVLPELEKAAAS
jgi:Trk K+ transport system NAD-binding subunit